MAERGLVLDELQIFVGGSSLVSLSTTVAPGEVVSVMGPSGVGKSSLLSAIIGTMAQGLRCTGDVRLNGQSVLAKAPEARRIGILYQDHLLFPHLSVAQNLAFGLARGGGNRKARVEAALADVGLAGYGARDPATLSGGQRARVALMRTLLAEPCALLLDEPFSRLDPDRRDQIRRLVFGRAREAGLPVLMVTHDPADANAAGGRVIVLGEDARL